MDNHSHFHSKKIDRSARDCLWRDTPSLELIHYDEKDTSLEKLLRRIVVIGSNVTFFAANLSSARSNWQDCVHSRSKRPLTLFYPN
jgi:hypothetical protein